jgi:hypothetical protein
MTGEDRRAGDRGNGGDDQKEHALKAPSSRSGHWLYRMGGSRPGSWRVSAFHLTAL